MLIIIFLLAYCSIALGNLDDLNSLTICPTSNADEIFNYSKCMAKVFPNNAAVVCKGIPEIGFPNLRGCTAANKSLVLHNSDDLRILFTVVEVCNLCEVNNLGFGISSDGPAVIAHFDCIKVKEYYFVDGNIGHGIFYGRGKGEIHFTDGTVILAPYIDITVTPIRLTFSTKVVPRSTFYYFKDFIFPVKHGIVKFNKHSKEVPNLDKEVLEFLSETINWLISLVLYAL